MCGLYFSLFVFCYSVQHLGLVTMMCVLLSLLLKTCLKPHLEAGDPPLTHYQWSSKNSKKGGYSHIKHLQCENIYFHFLNTVTQTL